MAKRGRKRKNTRKGYFYEEQEEAVINFLKAETKEEKNKIFQEILNPAFTKMIESIIRRYNLYPPDEIFDETFNDTMSFLMTKIEKFNPDSGYKAYSYCGTICKNYLIYKINQYAKNQKRNLPYDIVSSDLNEDIRYSYETEFNKNEFFNNLIRGTIKDIKETISNKENLKLNENEIKVGNALIQVLENWEELFLQMGSNKFNKSSILLFLKENTLLNTKEIRDGMKKYKEIYYFMKKKLL